MLTLHTLNTDDFLTFNKAIETISLLTNFYNRPLAEVENLVILVIIKLLHFLGNFELPLAEVILRSPGKYRLSEKRYLLRVRYYSRDYTYVILFNIFKN